MDSGLSIQEGENRKSKGFKRLVIYLSQSIHCDGTFVAVRLGIDEHISDWTVNIAGAAGDRAHLCRDGGLATIQSFRALIESNSFESAGCDRDTLLGADCGMLPAYLHIGRLVREPVVELELAGLHLAAPEPADHPLRVPLLAAAEDEAL